MVDILHKMGIPSSSAEKIYEALTTRQGLSGWWTTDVQGETNVGGVLEFRFGAGGIDMKVIALEPAKRVVWEVVAGPKEWLGTQVAWDIQPGESGWTSVLFKHRGWREPVDFMHHCSTKWGIFLLSLRALVETGKGSPAPNDLKIDSWE